MHGTCGPRRSALPRPAERDTALGASGPVTSSSSSSSSRPAQARPGGGRWAALPAEASSALPKLCRHRRPAPHPQRAGGEGGGGCTDASEPRSAPGRSLRPEAGTNLYSPRRWRSCCPRAAPAALPGSRRRGCRGQAGLSSAGVPARSPRSSSAGPPCPPGPASTRPPGTARRCGNDSARPHPPSRTSGSSQGAGSAPGPGTSGVRPAGPGARSKMAPSAPHPVAMATRKAAGPGGTLRRFTATLCGSRW